MDSPFIELFFSATYFWCRNPGGLYFQFELSFLDLVRKYPLPQFFFKPTRYFGLGLWTCMMSTPGGPPVLTPMLVRTPTDASPMMKPHPSTATLPPEFHPPVFGVGGSPQLPNPLTPRPSPLCPPPLTDGVQPAAHHTPRTVSPSHQPAPFTPVSHPKPTAVSRSGPSSTASHQPRPVHLHCAPAEGCPDLRWACE